MPDPTMADVTEFIRSCSTATDLLHVAFALKGALLKLGYREPMYAPEDDKIEILEFGSTGIHTGVKTANGFFIYNAGDLWPSDPLLWKMKDDQENKS